MQIKDQPTLRQMYGHAKGRASRKQLNTLEKHSINFIEHSPFVTISTASSDGALDCSPRGGATGFVQIISPTEIIIPDSKGNNRLDSISNILETGGIGCLFLIPGVNETLRINGKAEIRTEEKYLALFKNEKNPPKCVIKVTIEDVYLHCAKALMRSKLWSEDAKIERKALPTIAEMLKDQLNDQGPIETQEEMVARYKHDL